MATFFIQSTSILEGAVVLSGDLFYHIVKSLRTQPGQSLIFNDERGLRYYTTVSQITKTVLHCQIQRTETHHLKRVSPIVLGQALLKGEKMSWVIQKATELGVSTIVPLMTRHVIPRVRPEQTVALHDRWHRIGLEAAQQSERWSPPSISPLQSFTSFLQNIPDVSLKILLAERSSEQSLSQLPLPSSPQASIIVIVGPEGGWSQKELADARNFRLSFASLGKGILRAETASLAALAILQSRLEAL